MPREVVELIIEARDAATGELRKVKAEGTRMGDALGKATRKGEQGFNSLGKAITAARGVLTAFGAVAGLAGIIRIFQAATRASIDFEKQLVAIGKTTNITGRELSELGDVLTELAKEIATPTETILRIAEIAGQLGIQGSDSIRKFTETVGRLVISSNLTGETAATGLARLLAVTGENVNEVEKIASVLTRLGNEFAATESEILFLANEVARATTVFGVSAAEAEAFGVSLRELGNRAQLGGSATGRVFREIESAIKKGGEQAEKFAIIIGDTQDNIRRAFQEDAAGLFVRFLEGLKKVKEEGGTVATVLASVQLSGDELNKVLPSWALRVDRLKDAMRAAKEEMKDATALTKESQEGIETAAGATTTMKNAWGELLRKMGDTAPIEAAARAIAKLAEVQSKFLFPDSGASGLERALRAAAEVNTLEPGTRVRMGPLGATGQTLRSSQRLNAAERAEQDAFEKFVREREGLLEGSNKSTIEGQIANIAKRRANLETFGKWRKIFEEAQAKDLAAIESARSKEVLKILAGEADRMREFGEQHEAMEQAVADRLFDIRKESAEANQEFLSASADAVRTFAAERQAIVESMILNELLSADRRIAGINERLKTETAELKAELDKRLLSLAEFEESRRALEIEAQINRQEIRALEEGRTGGFFQGAGQGFREFFKVNSSEFERGRAAAEQFSQSTSASLARAFKSGITGVEDFRDAFKRALQDIAAELLALGIKQLLFQILFPGDQSFDVVAPSGDGGGGGGFGGGGVGAPVPARGPLAATPIGAQPQVIHQYFITANDAKSFSDQLESPEAQRKLASSIQFNVKRNAGVRADVRNAARRGR